MDSAKESLCDYFDYVFDFCEKPALEKSHCDQIQDDEQARELCYLLQERGYEFRQIDTGLSGKIFNPPPQFAQPNGVVESQEVYHEAIKIIEAELLSADYVLNGDETELFSYRALQAGFQLPWLVYSDAWIAEDDDALAQPDLKATAGNLIGDKKYNNQRSLAETIFDGIFSPSGLNLKVWSHFPGELDVGETLLANSGDSTELSRLLYSVYKYAGFTPRFVWVREDIQGNPLIHIAVAIECDGKEVIADSRYGFDAKHASVVDIPSLTAFSLYLDNLADQDADDKKAVVYLSQSLIYDPTFPLSYLYLSLERFDDDLDIEKFELYESAWKLDSASSTYLNVIESQHESR